MNAIDRGSATLAENVCRRIADDIVRGAFLPGTKLEGQHLANRYGISRTPVREALRQLVTTGLVEIRSRKGFTVSEIAIDKLALMFEAQGEVEALCARFAAQRTTATERRKLQLLHRHCQDMLDTDDIGPYFAADDALHDAIFEGAHNEFLATAAKGLRVRLAPFRYAHFRVAERSHSSSDEHGRIVEAIAAADAAAAGEAMRDHFTNSAVEALEYVAAGRTE